MHLERRTKFKINLQGEIEERKHEVFHLDCGNIHQGTSGQTTDAEREVATLYYCRKRITFKGMNKEKDCAIHYLQWSNTGNFQRVWKDGAQLERVETSTSDPRSGKPNLGGEREKDWSF